MPSYEYAKGHGHVHARYLSYQTIVVLYYYYYYYYYIIIYIYRVSST